MNASFRSGLRAGIDSGIKLSHAYASHALELGGSNAPLAHVLGLDDNLARLPKDSPERIAMLAKNREHWRRSIHKLFRLHGLMPNRISETDIVQIMDAYPELFEDVFGDSVGVDTNKNTSTGPSNTTIPVPGGAAIRFSQATEELSQKNRSRKVITRDSPEKNTRRNGSKKQTSPHSPKIGGGDGHRSISIRKAKDMFLSSSRACMGGFEHHQLDLMRKGVSSYHN